MGIESADDRIEESLIQTGKLENCSLLLAAAC